VQLSKKKTYISGTQSDTRDEQYRTEPDIGIPAIGLRRAEFGILSDIGLNVLQYPIFFNKCSVANPDSKFSSADLDPDTDRAIL
jgi:hypothetical protein